MLNFDIAMKIPQKKQAADIALTICSLSIFCGLISSCATEKYVAKPLDPQVVNAKISNKDISNTAFNAYLIKQGYSAADLPFQFWGLNELTLAALYFNPKLDVAKAQLALADTAIDTANQRQNPTLGGSLDRSNQANEDISPWAYGLTVDIPVETANKRTIRVENAQHLRDSAELDVAEIAWQLRSQIAKDLIAYHENIALQQQLSRELTAHNSIVNMLEKRFTLGLIDSSTLNNAKLMQQKIRIMANTLPMQLIEIRAALAADTGLSIEKLNAMPIKPMDVDGVLTQQSELLNQENLNQPNSNQQNQFKTLQQNALLNRLDIRRSLAKYAAAEAKIKLEVAKQTPDITLTPGYMFEFGDRIWSLGFSSLLNLLNKNQTLIAEATQLREVEGAQFEVLQTKIISDLNLAYAQLTTALQNIQQTQSQVDNQTLQQRQVQKQLDAGLTDRLTVTQQSLSYLSAEQQLLSLKFSCLRTLVVIEDLMQRPIYDVPTNAILNTQIRAKK